jgi:hypothetical protein
MPVNYFYTNRLCTADGCSKGIIIIELKGSKFRDLQGHGWRIFVRRFRDTANPEFDVVALM